MIDLLQGHVLGPLDTTLFKWKLKAEEGEYSVYREENDTREAGCDRKRTEG